MTAPANWYPDPSAPDQLRYWDGAHRTQHVSVAPAPVPYATRPRLFYAPTKSTAIASIAMAGCVVLLQLLAAVFVWPGNRAVEDEFVAGGDIMDVFTTYDAVNQLEFLPESRKRFMAALALLEAGESEALIFTKVDRASRCTEDFARLLRLSEERDWRLIVTEMGIDTCTPMGKAMAHMAVVFAELERDFIRMRTREALQVKKENGVTLGRPRSTPDDVVARVVRERTEGKTAYAIARDMNKDAVPTAQGARVWSQATVRALLMREGLH